MFYDGYYFLAGVRDFLFTKTVKTGCGTLPACHSGGTFVKRPGRHVCHSSPSNARLRMSGGVPLPPLCAFMAWAGTTLLFIVCPFSSFSVHFDPVDSIALFLEVGLLTAEQGKGQPKSGSMPYLHFSAKIAVFSKLPLRRLSQVKPRPQKLIHIKVPPLGIYKIISYALKGSLCHVKITHTFGVSSFSLYTRWSNNAAQTFVTLLAETKQYTIS